MKRLQLTNHLELVEGRTPDSEFRWNVICNCGCGHGIKLSEKEIETIYDAIKNEQANRN